MKITLRELRTLVRESVRQHLREARKPKPEPGWIRQQRELDKLVQNMNASLQNIVNIEDLMREIEKIPEEQINLRKELAVRGAAKLAGKNLSFLEADNELIRKAGLHVMGLSGPALGKEEIEKFIEIFKVADISSKIEKISNKLDEENYSMSGQDLESIQTIASSYKELKNKESLKEEMENLKEKLDNYKTLITAPPGYAATAYQEISDALSGRVHGRTPSPEETLRLLRKTGLGPGYPTGPDGKLNDPKLEEVTMSLQELRSLVREAVRKQIKK